MSTANSNLAKTKSLLLDMVAEANEFKRTAGGSVINAVAGWLAPQYMLAANEKLSETEGAQRWEILRVFAQDWAVLRHGDHTAERLRIERERLKLAKQVIKEKWVTKLEAGLGKLFDEIKNNPKARELFKPLHQILIAEGQPRKEKEFREWVKRPEIRKEIFTELTRGLSPETLKKIEEELHLL